jgi:hypothetical protein
LEFGAWLNGSIQILERAREYRPSNQPTAALLDCPARRFYEAARSVDVLAVRTMHVSSPPRAAFAVSATMLTLSLLRLGSSLKMTNLAKVPRAPGRHYPLLLANRRLCGRVNCFYARPCDKYAPHGHLQLGLQSAEGLECSSDVFLRCVSPKCSLSRFVV